MRIASIEHTTSTLAAALKHTGNSYNFLTIQVKKTWKTSRTSKTREMSEMNEFCIEQVILHTRFYTEKMILGLDVVNFIFVIVWVGNSASSCSKYD